MTKWILRSGFGSDMGVLLKSDKQQSSANAATHPIGGAAGRILIQPPIAPNSPVRSAGCPTCCVADCQSAGRPSPQHSQVANPAPQQTWQSALRWLCQDAPGDVLRRSIVLLALLNLVFGFASLRLESAELTPAPIDLTASAGTNRAEGTWTQLTPDARMALVFHDWDHLIEDWEGSWDDVGPGLISYIDEARLIIQGELQRIQRSRQTAVAELRKELETLKSSARVEVTGPKLEAAVDLRTNAAPVNVALTSLIPDERVWTLAGDLRKFIDDTMTARDGDASELVILLQEPLRLLYEESKRLELAANRDLLALRTEVAAVNHAPTSTNAVNPPSLVPNPASALQNPPAR